ncbi:response regulator transcription factor [Parasediminibacterium sp. JCM 36343]|uniref:response regulator transcription factor n=1 Tax=Parasediminibacterium sp. JCM 36343 TaxID=3374279 RepID=UPI0039792195
MEKIYRILLVEDEPKLNQVIKEELNRAGYQTDVAINSIEAESLFKRNRYSLVLLDINLPYKSGLELCREFREANKKIPIIMLTALGEIDDKVGAFNLGADDYIVKPFHFQELFARIKVFLKRFDKQTDGVGQIVVEDLIINLETKVVSRGDIAIPLTAKEFALLTLLCKNRGRVISKQEIMENVWDVSFDTGTNTIEVYISFLRNKVDRPFSNKLIFTKAGFGYYVKE